MPGERVEDRDAEPAAADEDGRDRTRRSTRSGSRQGARRLADLGVVLVADADRHQLVHRIEVVDVELAVEVVELVLEGPAEQARCRRP